MAKSYTFFIERTRTGYCGFLQQGGVFTVGSDMTELRANILEAMNFALEEQGETVTFDDVDIKYYKPFQVHGTGKRI